MSRVETSVVPTPLLARNEDDEVSSCCWWRHLGCCYLPVLFFWRTADKRRKALVHKNGSYRVYASGLGEHRNKFMSDIYITLIDLDWWCIMFTLFATFLVTFLVFAFCWWLMAFTNGDFDNIGNPDFDFCMDGVTSFASVLIFSMETQTTIGYGIYYPNARCGGTIPLMYLQVVVGLFLETLMLGAIFVKIARPKYRANTILMSKQAVINHEDGKLVLQVRIGDMRKSHLVNSTITGMVIRAVTTSEGNYYPVYQHKCVFTAHAMTDRVCLLWPIVQKHVINENSPLYDIRPGDAVSDHFEVILYLTGTVESTGEMCQARTSYLPKEILWGHRFVDIEEFDAGDQQWTINFPSFDKTIPCESIYHSAKDLDEFQADTASAAIM